MSLFLTIREAIAAARREAHEQGKLRLTTLSLLLAALQNEAIALRAKEQGLSDEQVIAVVRREVKRRKDAIELYLKGGREELADKEKSELVMIKKYLPEELSEAELQKIVKEVIAEMGAGAAVASQFGMVMKAVMAKTRGRSDGAAVSRIVKETIGNK